MLLLLAPNDCLLGFAGQMVCAVIAGALHYLFLASFCWMAMEGLQIYLKIVPAFKPLHSMIPVYFSIGYGVPAIIVAAAAGTFPQVERQQGSALCSKPRLVCLTRL